MVLLMGLHSGHDFSSFFVCPSVSPDQAATFEVVDGLIERDSVGLPNCSWIKMADLTNAKSFLRNVIASLLGWRHCYGPQCIFQHTTQALVFHPGDMSCRV